MVVVGLLAAVWSAAAAPARATFGAQTTADEPQYLLTALSLWEDGSLDIADELTAERWRDFHQANLPEQTEPRPDGRRLSPHDPLLPVLLAIPMGLGSWLGAKLALAAVAGGLAALLVWVAVRRFAVAPATAAVVVGAFAIVPPFAAYGTQVYPELPAALAVTLAIAAVTGPLGRGGRWLLGAAVIALPWLAVKYVPVAAVLVAIALIKLWRRGDRRPAVALAGGLALGGAAYLGFHRAVYGGWTVYASGDHFTSGELTVVGHQPNYAGRSTRLLGLMTDRYFGLAAWAPSWLLAIPALAAIARRRPTGWPALLAPAAVGWLIATFVALTMHGFWWPGRQVVVVLPAVVLAVAWWLPIRRVPAIALVAGTAMAVISWVWLLVEVLGERLNLVTAFGATTNPLFRAWHVLLPDYRNLGPTTWGLHGLWLAAALALAAYGWRTINHQGENHR